MGLGGFCQGRWGAAIWHHVHSRCCWWDFLYIGRVEYVDIDLRGGCVKICHPECLDRTCNHHRTEASTLAAGVIERNKHIRQSSYEARLLIQRNSERVSVCSDLPLDSWTNHHSHTVPSVWGFCCFNMLSPAYPVNTTGTTRQQPHFTGHARYCSSDQEPI